MRKEKQPHMQVTMPHHIFFGAMQKDVKNSTHNTNGQKRSGKVRQVLVVLFLVMVQEFIRRHCQVQANVSPPGRGHPTVADLEATRHHKSTYQAALITCMNNML